jgi:hypothetical protein
MSKKREGEREIKIKPFGEYAEGSFFLANYSQARTLFSRLPDAGPGGTFQNEYGGRGSHSPSLPTSFRFAATVLLALSIGRMRADKFNLRRMNLVVVRKSTDSWWIPLCPRGQLAWRV